MIAETADMYRADTHIHTHTHMDFVPQILPVHLLVTAGEGLFFLWRGRVNFISGSTELSLQKNWEITSCNARHNEREKNCRQ